jgi:RNA polymerase sigma factor (TIGR02999 family)
MAQVTQLLLEWRSGDEAALERLIPLVYQQLHDVARRYMRGERPQHTLQASALVNEAYLRLVDVRRIQWQDRAHFFAMSAKLMRRILVDFARSKDYQKRGGGAPLVTLHEEFVAARKNDDVAAIDEALQTLEALDSRKARIVEMRFFAGLTVAETAEALNISPETVMRDWKFAKAWLQNELNGGPAGEA